MAFKRIIPAILLIFLFLPLGTSRCSAGKNAPRPNFLIIITDDQRYDTMEYMPKTQAGIFDEGVTFSKGYITTPFCCPSRSSIFTGMYAHNHNVLQINMPLNIETIAMAL
jgi:arylsulfatase A-like enzyme